MLYKDYIKILLLKILKFYFNLLKNIDFWLKNIYLNIYLSNIF